MSSAKAGRRRARRVGGLQQAADLVAGDQRADLAAGHRHGSLGDGRDDLALILELEGVPVGARLDIGADESGEADDEFFPGLDALADGKVINADAPRPSDAKLKTVFDELLKEK